MLSKTTGIILRTLKYRETSLILDIYTEDFGLQSYIISGIRSKKSKTKSGLLQIPNIVDLLAYHKGNGTLQRIKEIKTHRLYQSIPFEIMKSSISMFLTEICRKTIKEEEANPGLFSFLINAFMHLDQTKESLANFNLGFLIHLSKSLGFMPDNNYTIEQPIFDLQEGSFKADGMTSFHFLDKELSLHFHELMNLDFQEIHNYKIPKSDRIRLLDNLLDYYQIHVESFGQVKSLEILKEILN